MRNLVNRDTIINATAIVEGVLVEYSVIGEHASVIGCAAKIEPGDSWEVVVA